MRCEPMPHDLVQVDQAPKGATTQSAAHACALHDRESTPVPQGLPPPAACTSTPRWRHCIPEPQLWLHVCQDPHAALTQSTGQACRLQFRILLAGHAVPLCAAATITVTCACCVPAPQLLEQAPHAPYVWTQCTGHMWVLHFTCSLVVGQSGAPNLDSVTMGRVRVVMPPLVPSPHGSEHGVHALHSPTTQCCGHSTLAQLRDETSEPQPTPPNSADRVSERDRISVA